MNVIESLWMRDLFAGCILHSLCKCQDGLGEETEGGREFRTASWPSEKLGGQPKTRVHGALLLVGLIFDQASVSVCSVLCLMVPWPVHDLGAEESP